MDIFFRDIIADGATVITMDLSTLAASSSTSTLTFPYTQPTLPVTHSCLFPLFSKRFQNHCRYRTARGSRS